MLLPLSHRLQAISLLGGLKIEDTTSNRVMVYSAVAALAMGTVVAINTYQKFAFRRECEVFRKTSRPAALAKLNQGLGQGPFGACVELRDNQITVSGDHSVKIQPEEIARLKKEIIHNPIRLLAKNELSRWKHRQTIADSKAGCLGGAELNVALMNYSFHAEDALNYLGMLFECIGIKDDFPEGDLPCNVCRYTDTSKSRIEFENKIVAELEHQLTLENGGSVTLVNVGSGDLLPDLRLITSFFECSKPGMHLNCVFIDRWYNQYINAMNNRKRVREPKIFDNEEKNIQTIHAQFTQLSRWVAQAYPQHELSIHVYGSVEDYEVALIEKPGLKPNIAMGEDLDSDYHTVPYLVYAENDKGTRKNGREAYLSAPWGDMLKPYGVGLMLFKEEFPQVSGSINHCLKILSADALKPDEAKLINSEKPTLFGRYVVLDETYRRPLLPIHLWRRLFGI